MFVNFSCSLVDVNAFNGWNVVALNEDIEKRYL